MNRKYLKTKRGFSLRRLVVTLVAIFAVSIYPFTQPTDALSVPSGSGSGLVVGSYNILGYYHGDGSRFNPARLKQIVTNINDMRYDVVGLQEYRDQKKGSPKAFESELQKLNPAYKMSYNNQGDQLNFVYNSSTVRLIEDRPLKVIASKNDCGGGTAFVRIAKFQTNSGQEFMVINAHPNSGHGPQKCDTERLNTVKGALGDSVVKSYQGPLFFVGDFNARPDKPSSNNYDPGPENYLKANGYMNARDVANASRKRGGNIDHIYYKIASVGAPSYYEALDCGKIPKGNPKLYKSSYTCASDHVPIKAVFANLSGSGYGCSGSVSSLSAGRQEQFSEWDVIFYDPSVGACCIASAGAGELIGDTNAEKVFNFLISTPIKTNNNQPLTQAQAAGAVGNLMRESGGDTYSLKPDITNSKSGAYGIVQWLGSRKTALENFAKEKGSKKDDLRTQLEFLIYELENKESAIVKDTAFQNVTNIADGAQTAAKRWDTLYERSGGSGINKRQENAKKAFEDFSSGAEESTTDSEADPNKAANSEDDEDETPSTLSSSESTNPGCSQTSGEYVFPLKASKADLRKWGARPGEQKWASGRYHENVFTGYYAVDIMAPEGTPVVAFHGGKVIHIGSGPYGELTVQIMDEAGYTYYYTHLSSSRGAQVKKDDVIESGTLIAYVGNDREGWNAGSHLHIDKSKNPGNGLRGTCTASRGYCPIASENRFVEIVVELHESYQKLPDTGVLSL